ncbi:uncharacterized protein LOC131613897 [Vicia villosa]|uniref:uncharacterized protein LOC131613897 n=1 Tax=Vicia villosa TaxID=3911 RepID=UPI00273AF0F3|nr:uncharacterized protein LOC131613897 [Vicia villosa]
MEDDWHVFFGYHATNLCWRAAGLSTIVDHRLQTFSDAKSIILDIYNKEDKKDAGRFALVLESLWKNSNNIVWNNNREDLWGWCLRDNMGRFTIAGVAWDNDILSPLEAEALALKEAIHSVLTMNLNNVIFESDSQVVIHGINSTVTGRSELNALIISIQRLLSSVTNFKVKFITLSSN